jgi:hypothetical protein
MTDHKHASDRPPIDSEIDVRRTIEVGAWLFGTTVGTLVIGYFLYLGLSKWSAGADPAPSPLVEANRTVLPPGPNLQAHPEGELVAMRAAERERLTSWGWADKSRNLAHMPIAEAMARLAVPAPAAPAATPAAVAPAAEGHAASAPEAGHAPAHEAPAH